MKAISIYFAGPLFGIADRHHNLLIAQELEKLGYRVVLPQIQALNFFDGQNFNLRQVREDCRKHSMESDIVVANIDGTDAGSGTALEVGLALAGGGTRPKVICVRTDFRTDLAKEIGINGMFGLADKIIYMPAFLGSLQEVSQFYEVLAKAIGNAIKELVVES